MRYFLSFAAACVAATFAIFGFTQAASAHAVLLGSLPAAQSVVDVAPQKIVLNFNENVGPIFFKVLDRTGAEVGNPGEIDLDGNDVTLPLGDSLENGTYIITYRVVSADTHPVGASFAFSIGEPLVDTSGIEAGSGGTSGWWVPVAINRYIQYAAMLLTAGSALFVLLMQIPREVSTSLYRVGRASAGIGTMSYVLSIGFGGAEMVMGGPGAIFSTTAWSQGLSTTLGPSALIGIPGLILLFYAFGQAVEKSQTGLFAVGSVLSVTSFLVTGHAATAPPVWLLSPVVAVHLFCAAFWLAALYPLYKITEESDITSAGAVMSQFSNRAVWSVGALFLSGFIITWTQLQTPDAVLGTDYGLRLLFKFIIFVVLLGLAAINKTVLTPALEKGEGRALEKMRQSIRFEYAAMVLIIGAAVSLTLVSPPRAIVDSGKIVGSLSDVYKATTTARNYVLDIEVTPARTGENMIMFMFKDANDSPVEMVDVLTTWALPAAGLEGVSARAEAVSPGMFHLMIGDLIIPGEWTVRVGAFVDDFDKVNFDTSVVIK